jgi:hypothetical protein
MPPNVQANRRCEPPPIERPISCGGEQWSEHFTSSPTRTAFAYPVCERRVAVCYAQRGTRKGGNTHQLNVLAFRMVRKDVFRVNHFVSHRSLEAIRHEAKNHESRDKNEERFKFFDADDCHDLTKEYED